MQANKKIKRLKVPLFLCNKIRTTQKPPQTLIYGGYLAEKEGFEPSMSY